MFPDCNDNEYENNGDNISTFPPPYLSSNSRVHIKLPDSSSFQNGFLHKSDTCDMWKFYPGSTRKVKPILLSLNLLKSLFSSGLIRRGNKPQSTNVINTSVLPHWVLHGKITLQLPQEIHFRRGYIISKHNDLFFAEGLKRTQLKNETKIDAATLLNLLESKLILKGHNHRLTEHTSQSTIPRLRPVDTVLQSTPSKIQLTDTDLRQGFGFRNTATISKRLHSFTTNNFIHSFI